MKVGQPGGFDKENCYKNKSEYIKNHNDLYSTALHLLMERCSMQITKFPNFCESIVFVDSDYYSGVQLADFCAGAIYRKYENNETDFFEELKPAIRKHHNSIYGAGIKLY